MFNVLVTYRTDSMACTVLLSHHQHLRIPISLGYHQHRVTVASSENAKCEPEGLDLHFSNE